MTRAFCNKHSETYVPCCAGTKFYLHRYSTFTFIIAALIYFFANIAAGQSDAMVDLSDANVRQGAVERLAGQSQKRKAAAWSIAQAQGWLPKETINNTTFELMAIEGNRVYVYKTCNVNSAISIGVNQIRNTVPYNVNGAGLTVGIWDAGAVRPTHQEFLGRVNVKEGMSNHNHSTHVGGTIGAAGVEPIALGMAPSVLIDSYEWNQDVSEMTSRAMSYPNEPGTIPVSNHSYSYICGWEHSYSPPRWYGTWGNRESDYFGIYDSEVVLWDELCYNAPYYLPIKAAGNDRNDKAPNDGETFEYYKFPRWRTKTYDSTTDPYDDGWDNGGFDTITIVGVAKNIMTVGAVYDAVTGGVRDPNKGTMTSFSGWGPTDDGRIKPDIVTNGTSLYSPIASSDTSYASYTGTSMAAPSVAGAAMLLVQYYGELFPGEAMRASTLKALIIHTADDLGNAGPDYKFGWGLMNAKAAADHIADHNDFPDGNKIVVGALDDSNIVNTYAFESDGGSPIRATLCWTDPPATAASGLDNPSPRLINDLDLRITDPNGITYYPYVLNPASPNYQATTGDNTLENVEQVLIHSPNVPGSYSVQISYKGTLINNQQHYSLILSGQLTAQPLLGDFNDDGSVNFEDLATLLSYWLTDESSVDIAPLSGDGIINFLDFARFAQDWTP
ncbi:MAG: S8 family serine peptidase [Planctomycetota bacterium]|nr:MAG: S8 family serine peptidase [Planctomycetota bacterium]